ncbi:hypothetical protein SLEP1_g51361 [Rubroshorea leprosula]|uniref:F-box domain-containing protein n=1 Tax=Rubroshorea leprosula TaxID=152421 RepID=A0AAV5M2Y4_9ROSI|nr:hypothetical protein SLEP1_g51361 [Rubroshorea leprosula]
MSSSWSDLPKDLLTQIAEKLETPIDILRCRSVCPSWRSSIPPFRRSTHFPIILPSRVPRFPHRPIFRRHPRASDSNSENRDAILYERPIYRRLPPASNPNSENRDLILRERPIYRRLPLASDSNSENRDLILYESIIYRLDPPASNSNSENSGSWLFRIKETTPGRVRLQKPLSKGSLRPLPCGFPKDFNLLDFRVSELCKVYNVLLSLRFPSAMDLDVSRVALSSRPKSSNDDYVLLAIYSPGFLCSIKLGDGEWTVCEDGGKKIFHDIINFNGKFYAVDTSSRISVFDELSLQLIEVFEPAMSGDNYGDYFRLVKSSEHLFLVSRNSTFYSGGLGPYEDNRNYYFRFFKLNQGLHGLEEVYSFGDQVLFLGEEFSFSVSTREFTGLEPDCLYFVDNSGQSCFNIEVDGVGGNLGNIGVYKLWDRKEGSLASYPGCSKIFWPPPAWLQSGPSPSSSDGVSCDMGKEKKIKGNLQLQVGI